MNNLLNKKTVKTVSNFLDNINKDIKIIVLNASAKTSNEAAKSLGVKVGAIVKSLLFISDKKDIYILCLVSGDKIVSVKKLTKIINANIHKADADDVKKITGYSIGGVPPVAHKNKIPIYIDNSLSKFKKLYAAAGHPYCVFEISYKNLVDITKGIENDIIL